MLKIHCVLKPPPQPIHCVLIEITHIKTGLCPHVLKHTVILRNLVLLIVLSTAGLFVLLICLSQPRFSSSLFFFVFFFTAGLSYPQLCLWALIIPTACFDSLHSPKSEANKLVICIFYAWLPVLLQYSCLEFVPILAYVLSAVTNL